MSEPHDIRLARALRDIHVRFARDAEGMMIAQMVHGSHEHVPHVGWEKVYPYWLLAEHQGEPVAAVQLCYSLPVGRLEFLSFIPGLSYRVRALVVRSMLSLAMATLAKTGCHSVAGCVPFDQRSYRDILKANGCEVLMSGNILLHHVSRGDHVDDQRRHAH